jgi:hypothetical protein
VTSNNKWKMGWRPIMLKPHALPNCKWHIF